VNPATFRQRLLTDINYRPFRLGEQVIYYKDMTRTDWNRWITVLKARITDTETSITWAERNIALLRSHKVAHSGDLPDDVKRSVFREAGSPEA